VTEKPARKHRRAQLPAVPGTDPTPQAVGRRSSTAPVRATEDTDQAWGDRQGEGNDEQLKRDVPPHW
jgi:high-mobility group nucleosome-binding domain-containing protein 2